MVICIYPHRNYILIVFGCVDAVKYPSIHTDFVVVWYGYGCYMLSTPKTAKFIEFNSFSMSKYTDSLSVELAIDKLYEYECIAKQLNKIDAHR